MLTKQLLKYKCTKGRLVPTFIFPGDDKALQTSHSLTECAKKFKGHFLSEFENEVDTIPAALEFPGLRKIFCDHFLEFNEKPFLTEKRFEWIYAAQDLRESHFWNHVSEYQTQCGKFAESGFESLSQEIFGDLPQFRIIQKIKLSPDDLIKNYNCILVQSLFLKTKQFICEIELTQLDLRRSFFNALKRSRLLFSVSQQNENCFVIDLGKSLQTFSSPLVLGRRIAEFFPEILKSSDWHIDAVVEAKSKNYRLALTSQESSKFFQPLYSTPACYIPSDLQSCVGEFNQSGSEWKLESSSEVLFANPKTWIVPDLTLSSKRGILHVELFHKWNESQIGERLRTISTDKSLDCLLIGIEKKVFKKLSELHPLIAALQKQLRVFIFNEILTVQNLQSVLNHDLAHDK